MDALSTPALTGIRRLSALDTVRARIALAVELGLLQPGEPLPPGPEIARALGVGEPTVRRALESLCADGVLERRRGRGGGTLVAANPVRGTVAEINAYTDATAEVHELIDHRLALESGLVHLAALRRSDADVVALHELVDGMENAHCWAEFHDLDARFHRTVIAASGLPSAVARYDDLMRDLYRYYLPYPIEYLLESNREHDELVTAIEHRDPAAAVAVTCKHVEVLHQTMLSRHKD
ncbi:FCD domain-containing protein [Kibdelosporangium philippinense]|uniref:FCD domain-containing protein n=1 Tax=Kibdelosporangium philippinense TaxID=211113 RepID=A0ABS8ZUY5_9PSEU|nr:FCD domain-containing protein [Kibdelosporangium philippinense]MCE7011053.1 FCD domain-containing protein [Kibdelosporangium philippinense]